MIFRRDWRLLCATQARGARILSVALLFVCSWLSSPPDLVAGQGVTTASIAGVVKDSQGAVTPGATIVAVHRLSDRPAGTARGCSQST